MTAIRAAVDIPARVMIRLADGFAAGAVERLVAAAREMREAGAEEFVLGFLDADGQVDLAAVERVAAELEGCRWTFHRAIDHATDRDTVRKQLADFPGPDTYLTAGSAEGVDAGVSVLCAEAARRGEPGYGQQLLVGAGCGWSTCRGCWTRGWTPSTSGRGAAGGLDGAGVGGGRGSVADGAGRLSRL